MHMQYRLINTHHLNNIYEYEYDYEKCTHLLYFSFVSKLRMDKS